MVWKLQFTSVKLVALKCLWIRIPENQRFAFLNVPQHVYNEPLKLNGIEFQNHFIKIEEVLTIKQTWGVPLNKQNRPSLTIMPREINVVNFRDKIVNFDRQIKYKMAYKAEEYDLNIFLVALLKTFYTILTQPEKIILL